MWSSQIPRTTWTVICFSPSSCSDLWYITHSVRFRMNTVQADYHVPSVLVFFFDIIHNRKTTTPATETGEHHQRRVDWDRLDGLGQRTTWDVSINYECQLKEIRNGMSRNEHEDPFNATTTNVIARAVLGWDRQSASLASRWEWNVRGLLINFH